MKAFQHTYHREFSDARFVALGSLLDLLFPSAAAMFRHSAGHCKACEKQVAMIAQKVVDAKQPQQ